MSVAGFELSAKVVCDVCRDPVTVVVPYDSDADGIMRIPFRKITEKLIGLGYKKHKGDDICPACQKQTVMEG